MRLSINSIYEVLEFAEKLDKKDLILLQDHLCLIRNTKFPVKVEADKRDIPEYNPQPLRSEVNSLAKPPYVPAPPILVWKDCTCNNFWNLVCKCGGGRWVTKEVKDET